MTETSLLRVNGLASVYPTRGRTAWILAQRPPRAAAPGLDAPQGVSLEQERLASGAVVDSGAVLLTDRECPWRCLMCDLWKDATRDSVPEGAIPRQVESAVRTWSASGPLPAQVKLYNSGSFFDPAAVPPADYAPVARRIAFARNVVVESHPLLVGEGRAGAARPAVRIARGCPGARDGAPRGAGEAEQEV